MKKILAVIFVLALTPFLFANDELKADIAKAQKNSKNTLTKEIKEKCIYCGTKIESSGQHCSSKNFNGLCSSVEETYTDPQFNPYDYAVLPTDFEPTGEDILENRHVLVLDKPIKEPKVYLKEGENIDKLVDTAIYFFSLKQKVEDFTYLYKVSDDYDVPNGGQQYTDKLELKFTTVYGSSKEPVLKIEHKVIDPNGGFGKGYGIRISTQDDGSVKADLRINGNQADARKVYNTIILK